MTSTELYDAAREKWVIGSRRYNAQYAIATYRGLTREVFEIESWYPLATNNSKNQLRWGFKGHIAPHEIRNNLIYKSIKHLFKKGEASPIKYLNVSKSHTLDPKA